MPQDSSISGLEKSLWAPSRSPTCSLQTQIPSLSSYISNRVRVWGTLNRLILESQKKREIEKLEEDSRCNLRLYNYNIVMNEKTGNMSYSLTPGFMFGCLCFHWSFMRLCSALPHVHVHVWPRHFQSIQWQQQQLLRLVFDLLLRLLDRPGHANLTIRDEGSWTTSDFIFGFNWSHYLPNMDRAWNTYAYIRSLPNLRVILCSMMHLLVARLWLVKLLQKQKMTGMLMGKQFQVPKVVYIFIKGLFVMIKLRLSTCNKETGFTCDCDKNFHFSLCW